MHFPAGLPKWVEDDREEIRRDPHSCVGHDELRE
jgi:hypothetical protein